MKSVKRTCSTSPRASGVLAVLTVHYDCHSVKIETELLICSIACHSLHEKWLCIFMLTKPASVESPGSFAVPLFPISPLLLLFFVFPDSSVLSTLSLGQIRLSCIPDIPAAYVRNSIWLLWARIVSSTPFFPSLCSLPIACLSTHLHLDCPGWGFTVRFDPPHPLLFISGCIIQEREADRTGGGFVEGLETGLYTDNKQPNTKRIEFIWDRRCAFSATAKWDKKKEKHSGVEWAGREIEMMVVNRTV